MTFLNQSTHRLAKARDAALRSLLGEAFGSGMVRRWAEAALIIVGTAVLLAAAIVSVIAVY